MRLKSFLYLTLSLIIGFYFLSFTSSQKLESGLETGSTLPAISLQNEESTINLKKNDKEQYVFLNIWASYDAKSRIENIEFSSLLEKYTNESKLQFVSVSFDNYRSVTIETAKKDGINTKHLFIEKAGFDSELAKKLQLREGLFYNCLIDNKGNVIATNMNSEKLEEFIQQIN